MKNISNDVAVPLLETFPETEVEELIAEVVQDEFVWITFELVREQLHAHLKLNRQ